MQKKERILNVVDEQENVVGEESREIIHKEGLLHKEIHVWFYTPKGELIFQHRAKDKESHPNLLDATVGGHVEIGEDYIGAAVKETEEETGLKLEKEDIQLMDKFKEKTEDPVTSVINNAFRQQFAYFYKGKVSDLKVEEGKALGFEVWPIDTILNIDQETKKRFIPIFFSPIMIQIFKKIKTFI